MIFGEQLRALRRESGLSLRNLATAINVTSTYLSDVENGKTKAPSKELTFRIVAELKLETEKSRMLMDVAARERDELPADIYKALEDFPALITLIRTGVAFEAGDDTWCELTHALKNQRVRGTG